MRDALRDDASAATIADAVRTGTESAIAVIEAALARIEARDGTINAFTAVAAARARARAAQLDAARHAGIRLGPLAGVPFGVKAMIDVAGLTTTAGSALHCDDPPALRDAVVVRQLEDAGAVCVGALNMDEFGMGGTTENALFGPTRNPHDATRTPGGSSGGSAAAVAAGLVPVTLGADGLGSIRLPASLCGVYGLRPTRGAVSSQGLLGAGDTISTIGPLARGALDIALCHDVLCAGEPGAGRTIKALAAGIADLRLARAGGYFAERLDTEAADALERAAHALQVTRVVEFPEPRRARAAAMLVHTSESVVGKLDALRSRLDSFDPLTRERFLAHALLPAQWYLHAQRFRRWHTAEVMQLFKHIDVLLLPATPCVAPPIGTRTINVDGEQRPTGPTLGWFTQPLAGTDCPTLAVPIMRDGKLPMGVQLFAAPNREDLLLRVAAQLEKGGTAFSPIALPAA
jgi:AtzE family amidohydrolase